jgi:hypothetical protein
MNKTLIAATASLLFAGGAFAAAGKPLADTGVTESTDPAKVAAVERHAEELQARSLRGVNSSGTTASKSTSKAKHTKRTKKHTQAAAAPKSTTPTQ